LWLQADLSMTRLVGMCTPKYDIIVTNEVGATNHFSGLVKSPERAQARPDAFAPKCTLRAQHPRDDRKLYWNACLSTNYRISRLELASTARLFGHLRARDQLECTSYGCKVYLISPVVVKTLHIQHE
jgi:hypothetical protein